LIRIQFLDVSLFNVYVKLPFEFINRPLTFNSPPPKTELPFTEMWAFSKCKLSLDEFKELDVNFRESSTVKKPLLSMDDEFMMNLFVMIFVP